MSAEVPADSKLLAHVLHDRVCERMRIAIAERQGLIVVPGASKTRTLAELIALAIVCTVDELAAGGFCSDPAHQVDPCATPKGEEP